mgnify:CR=1 FL=1
MENNKQIVEQEDNEKVSNAKSKVKHLQQLIDKTNTKHEFDMADVNNPICYIIL